MRRFSEILSIEDIVARLEASNALESLSAEKAQRVRDTIKRLTPHLVARYEGKERVEIERDMNDETKALMYLLEEVEIYLR